MYYSNLVEIIAICCFGYYPLHLLLKRLQYDEYYKILKVYNKSGITS